MREDQPDLNCAAGVWSRPLQRDDDLRLAGGEVPGRHAVQWGGGVDLVSHHHRPVGGEIGPATVNVAPELHAGHVVGHHLPLLGGNLAHQLTRDHTANQTGRPQHSSQS